MRNSLSALAVLIASLAVGQASASARDIATDVRMAGELANAIGGTTLCGYALDMDKVRDWLDYRVDAMPMLARDHFRATLYRSQAGFDALSNRPNQAFCAARADLASKYDLLEDQR